MSITIPRSMVITLIFALGSIIMLSVGQTLLKYGLNQIEGFSLSDGIRGIYKLVGSPWVILGFACYGISSTLWMDVLSKLDFSFAFPMVGSTYILTLLIGYFIFHETVGWDRILGVTLIIIGLFFLVKSGV